MASATQVEREPTATASDRPANAPRNDRQIMGRLWPYLRPYRSGFLLGSLCGVGDSGLQTLIIFQISGATNAAEAGNTRRLTLTLATLIVLVLVKSAFNFGQEILVNASGLKSAMDLRNDTYRHIQTLSLSYFHRTRTGQLMSRLTNDVRVIEDGLTMHASNAVTGPFTILFSICAVIYINWRLSLVGFLLVPLVVGVVQIGSRPMRRAAQQKQERQAGLATVLEETINGIRVVQSFGMEAREIARFQNESREAYRAGMRGVRVISILTPTMEIISITAVVVVLAFAALELRAGRIHTGGLLSFILYLNSLAGAFRQLGRTYTSFQQTMNASERLFQLMDEIPDVRDRSDALPLPTAQGDIRFEGVTFGYDPGLPILHDVTFHAAPGQTVAFVGESGAGKSTLVTLVPRFYDPQAGAIVVDGSDLRDVRLADLRRHIGIVPQETLLFSGSVAENIAYGKPDATREEIEDAARAANAHRFVIALPDGYETMVGERGAKLSGGQRQRIAIARAVLKDPAILILDEATSALDPESEHLVSEALERLMQNRTTLVIAHRFSTIRRADRILVMKAGRIIESGTEEALLASNGEYGRLYRAQFTED